VLATLPTDGRKLEALIVEHGEMAVAIAWTEYCSADEDEAKWMKTRDGERVQIEYPLAYFLKHPEGFLVFGSDIANPENRVKVWDFPKHADVEMTALDKWKRDKQQYVKIIGASQPTAMACPTHPNRNDSGVI
jgi:hypothetical protein